MALKGAVRVGTPYLPEWYLTLAGKLLDRKGTAARGSGRILRRVADGKADDADWLYFYAIQSYGWGGVAAAGAVFAGLAGVLSGPFGYGPVIGFLVLCGVSVMASAAAFFAIIQLHIMLVDKEASYFHRPRAVNVVLVPIVFVAALVVLLVLTRS